MPNKRQTGWENLAESAARGNYELVEPLDYIVLGLLPEEGELVMGYYPYAKTAGQLIKEQFTDFSPGEMAGVLKRLNVQGLVARVKTRNVRTYGYQRTTLGKKLLEQWHKNNPTGKNGGGKSDSTS